MLVLMYVFSVLRRVAKKHIHCCPKVRNLCELAAQSCALQLVPHNPQNRKYAYQQ